ncbi:MAG TPA: hypothetical protein DDY49_14545 [Paenibacillaceae bacterium]|nr:hypothetical protein [Paenibacillaceae bacterium]
MVKVFLFKEQVYSVDEDLLPSFRKLCEQVGYRTHYNHSNLSLYLKPWLDGKRIIIQLKKDHKQDMISRLENLLTPYGADIESTHDTKGDLFFYLQFSNQEQLEILYSSSHNKGGKELANSLYTSFLEYYPQKVAKPISLWNPFSNDKHKKLLGKIYCPAIIINLPNSISTEDINQGILQGILHYYKVPILLPQNNSPKIWEEIILQVLEIKKQELFNHQEEKNIPIPISTTPVQIQPAPEPIPEPKYTPELEPVAQVQLTPELQPLPVEELPPLQKAVPTLNKPTKSPQEIVQERINELKMQIKSNPGALNNQNFVVNQEKLNQARINQARVNQTKMNQNPWDSLKSHPNWNQSSLMKKSTHNANGPIIDPFKQKKSKSNSNQFSNEVNPFGKGKR